MKLICSYNYNEIMNKSSESDDVPYVKYKTLKQKGKTAKNRVEKNAIIN
jgi:hypothetical protein